MTAHHRPTVETLADGLQAGDRASLARAITLVESRRADHARDAQELLRRVLPRTGGARRIGVTGVPGVGKSTFIESFGMMLCEQGHKVAVLAVDPSSRRTGGSILGDKTRMVRLTQEPNAFIRPSPAGVTLGGVARKTRESMLLCEAAGYDVVLVETVGVGQSETVVADMVDVFLVLMLPGAGDELQGIKKGLLEIADVIAVNKAEGDNMARARAAAADYRAALSILTPVSAAWRPEVTLISGLTGKGLAELWAMIERHRAALEGAGELEEKRRGQDLRWFRALLADALEGLIEHDPALKARRIALEAEIMAGRTTPALAADELISRLTG